MDAARRADDPVPDEGPTEVTPEGSGKQFADDVADVEETPTAPDADQGKGFAKGTPPEPTPTRQPPPAG